MRLIPREVDKFALHEAAFVAQKRLARGNRLNSPEAVALIASQVLELIRDGKTSGADLMNIGRQLLGRKQVMHAVPYLCVYVQLEGTFPDGSKLVTIDDPFPNEHGDLELALHGSFLPVPPLSAFEGPEDVGEIPGELLLSSKKVSINPNRKAVKISVTNTGDRPVQIGSHYHFIETNSCLKFDREKAYGKRLHILAGTAVRFEAGMTKEVTLVEIGGNKKITGGNGLATGFVNPEHIPKVMKAVLGGGFGHSPESKAIHGTSGEGEELALTVTREQYTNIFGPTVGDKVRLGDTNLLAEVEKDFAVYGDECKFGGGKVLREGMGQVTGYRAADVLDVVITNALVIDYTGIYKADIGIKNGFITGIGKAGNPDVMDGVHPNLVVGVNTEAVAGEGSILTAGGLDTHIHFICPQIVNEAIAGGVTTLIGGGTGPAHGTLATTCTPSPEQMRTMLIATDQLPVNFGFTGKGNTSAPEGLADIIKAGAIGLKLHEDWGTTPAAIDNCLNVAEKYDVQVTIHTDTLNESGCVEDTIKAFKNRGIHTYHSEGAGGGHAPDIIKVCSLENVLPSSTNPTKPYTINTIAEHRDMLMVCHHLDKNIVEDVAFADSRIRSNTIAAEDILHDMGALSIISSDSQAMGRIGEVITRTWQTAHKMKMQRGQLPEAKGVDNDNLRIKRFISKYTINPAIAHGVSHLVGSVEVGKYADLVLWDPAYFGAKPEIIIKGGTIAYAQMGDANASIPPCQPKLMRPMFAATGKGASLHSIAFVSQAALKAGVKESNGLQKRVEAVKDIRNARKKDMKFNSATPVITVDPTTYITTADGEELTCGPIFKQSSGVLFLWFWCEKSGKPPTVRLKVDLFWILKRRKGSTSLMDHLLKGYFTYAKPTGSIKVEHVLGKSAATHVNADYPLQFMLPKKAIPAGVDAILVYALTFGGGIVSGDAISCEMKVCADTTVVLTTQGCTNIFKSVKGKTSYQMLKASVGSGALLAILPDSLVCFANARYSQVQAFDLAPDANLVLVDWLTSGRIARGEVWNFDCFKSINHIYIQGNMPVLLDSVCLEQGVGLPFADRMNDFHVIGLVVIYGPKLASIRKEVQLQVQKLTDRALNNRQSLSSRGASGTYWPTQARSTPLLFASCSTLGQSEEGLVVRLAAKDTKVVYQFLREQLSALQPLIGVLPYAQR